MRFECVNRFDSHSFTQAMTSFCDHKTIFNNSFRSFMDWNFIVASLNHKEKEINEEKISFILKIVLLRRRADCNVNARLKDSRPIDEINLTENKKKACHKSNVERRFVFNFGFSFEFFVRSVSSRIISFFFSLINEIKWFFLLDYVDCLFYTYIFLLSDSSVILFSFSLYCALSLLCFWTSFAFYLLKVRRNILPFFIYYKYMIILLIEMRGKRGLNLSVLENEIEITLSGFHLFTTFLFRFSFGASIELLFNALFCTSFSVYVFSMHWIVYCFAITWHVFVRNSFIINCFWWKSLLLMLFLC